MDKIKLVLDPGHPGNDDKGEHPRFAVFADSLNMRLNSLLEMIFSTHPEYEIWCTRNKYFPFILEEITNLANEKGARIVSVHCQEVDDPKRQYLKAWCFGRQDKDGRRSEGYRLANAVAREAALLGIKRRSVKPIFDPKRGSYVGRKLWLLRKCNCPAILIECGLSVAPVLSETGEYAGNLERLAAAVFMGVHKILKKKGGEGK